MCRIEERVYVTANGGRQKFEEVFACQRASQKRLCSNVQTKTTEYFSRSPVPRDDNSSPASNNPSTPSGAGSYRVEQRRPSTAERRSSFREGTRAVNPEIVIEFGSKQNKGKKYYPSVSLSTKAFKRSSLGASSMASNEGAIDSPDSDASYKLRTGFPETPNAFDPSHGYATRTTVPQGHQHHVSSSSSFTTSSKPPSLYSDPDSPTTKQKAARYPPTVVHNPSSVAAPSPSSASRANEPPPYHAKIVQPLKTSRDNVGPDGFTPLGYSGFISSFSASHSSSDRAAAPEITDRANYRDERRRQEKIDRLFAEKVAKEEEAKAKAREEEKQVRFVLDRPTERARQRSENLIAETEKRRAEEREEARQRKYREQQLKDEIARKEKEVKLAEAKAKRDTRPPTRDYAKRKPGSRRPSITQADVDVQRKDEKRKHELALEEAFMKQERAAAEQRERDERLALLRQQQATTEYYNPRGGDRNPVTNNTSSVGRRPSVSGRRPSISSAVPPPTGLGRTSSQRRVSIVQDNPPVVFARPNPPPPQQQYYTRPPSSHQNQPPLLSPASSTTNYSQPPSARHASYVQDNPFAQPSARIPANGQENPFAQTSARKSPPMAQQDPWDSRDMRESLPRIQNNNHARQALEDQQSHTLRRRGEDVISRAAIDDRNRGHDRVRQATRNIGKVVGYENDYLDDSDIENEADAIAGYGPRLGLGGHGKRKS